MAELKSISDLYEPLALAVTQVYFALERLADVHFLYQYPIQYLLQILGFVLSQHPAPSQTTPPEQRIPLLRDAILSEVARRVSKGLLQEDQLVLALRMAQIALQGQSDRATCEKLITA